MEIRITKEEFDRIQKYVELRAQDPCKKCSVNKTTCTGCTNKKAYDIECKDTYLDYIYNLYHYCWLFICTKGILFGLGC
jgi:hypothetical protein